MANRMQGGGGGSQTCHHKLVLLGETAVGKTCVTIRFVRNEFFEFQEPTIGAAFLTQSITLDNMVVKFEIWDTAGQERYRSLAPMYYRGATAAIIVYDVTNPSSFEGAKSWVKELQRRGDPKVVIALAANKADLEHKRKVPIAEGDEYAQDNGIIHMQTSAKTGMNIKDLFVEIAKRLPRSEPAMDKGSAIFTPPPPQKTNENCGC